MPAPSTLRLDQSLRLSKAASLAGQGRYAEAELLLAPDGRASQDTLLLHAQAALATRSGDYSRGMHLWQMLLQRDPANTEARRMIDSIDVWLSRPYWFRYLPAGAAVFATLLIGLLILSAASGTSGKPAARNVESVSSPSYQTAARPTSYAPQASSRPAQAGSSASYPNQSYNSQPSSSPTQGAGYGASRSTAAEPSISLSLPAPKPSKKK